MEEAMEEAPSAASSSLDEYQRLTDANAEFQRTVPASQPPTQPASLPPQTQDASRVSISPSTQPIPPAQPPSQLPSRPQPASSSASARANSTGRAGAARDPEFERDILDGFTEAQARKRAAERVNCPRCNAVCRNHRCLCACTQCGVNVCGQCRGDPGLSHLSLKRCLRCVYKSGPTHISTGPQPKPQPQPTQPNSHKRRRQPPTPPMSPAIASLCGQMDDMRTPHALLRPKKRRKTDHTGLHDPTIQLD